MDKYTRIKTELDKQKQFGAQLSSNLRQAQRKKNRTMSSYRTIANSTSSNFFNAASMYRVTHFSHYFPRSKIKKKIKVEIDDNNNVKKIKEELEKCKKDFEKKENSYISQMNLINKKYEDIKLINENLEGNIKELKKNKSNEIEKEIKKRERMLEEEKEKYKREIDRINNEIEKLKKENALIKNDNNKVMNINNELENYKKKDDDNKIIINDLKMENERLKKQSSLNFKLIKEENDELIKEINKLNEEMNLMKKKEKEKKIEEEKKEEERKKEEEKREKEKKERERKEEEEKREKAKKEEEEKRKEKERIEKEEKLKKIEKERIEKEKNEKYKKFMNLKVMRIFSNSYKVKNTNNEKRNYEELEKKYNELKIENNKTNENSMRIGIVHLKEIKTLKEKYEKEIKLLKEKNTSLNKEMKELNTTNKISLDNNTKKIMNDLCEQFINKINSEQKKYENKINMMKIRIKRIKNLLMKYMSKNKNKEEDKNIIIINNLKEEISKIEKGKQKLEVQISSYDINFKKQNNEISKLKNELSAALKKVDKLKNEIKLNGNDKYELDDMNKKLKKQLEMYKIENNGKSKVIEERNNEISKLKELLNKNQ